MDVHMLPCMCVSICMLVCIYRYMHIYIVCVVSICLYDVHPYIGVNPILTYFNCTRYITLTNALPWAEVLNMHIYIYMNIYEWFVVLHNTWNTSSFYCVFYYVWNTFCFYLLFLHDILNMYCLHTYFVICYLLVLGQQWPNKYVQTSKQRI